MGTISRSSFEVKAFFLLGLTLLSYGAEAARRGLVGVGPVVFDVTKFGAKADGKTDSAMPIIRAWNAACQSTVPAKLLIPKGTFLAAEIFFQGPCTTPSPVIVEVQGTMLGTTDLSDYPNGQWLSFEQLDGVILTGGGTINGQGESVWKFNDRKRGSRVLLPISIKLQQVKNAIIRGINLVNSKGFHMTITSCNNVTVQDLHITAPMMSPNTDGIHLSRSDLISISKSVIGTGDDCVSVGEGSTNIAISDIKCGPGHGISIGSLGKHLEDKDVRGVTVTNCTLTNTTNGARIKTFHQSPHIQASSITFQDIVMNNVKNPIIIDQHYMSKKKKGQSNVKISDVHYRNIRGTSTTNAAVALNCSTTVPCEGIELVDIDLTYSGTSLKDFSLYAACSSAKAIFKGKQSPKGCL